MRALLKALWILLQLIITGFIVFASNYYLQLSQNEWSWELASNFSFDWHVEKFILSCLVLFVFWWFLFGLTGSWFFSLIFYMITIGILGYANAQKMLFRMEPIYPDDLTMVSELGLMKDMIGTKPFYICIGLVVLALAAVIFAIYRSLYLSKPRQIFRISSLIISGLLLLYIGNFNQEGNLVRKQFDRTALWVSYSQKMNYYNTGFIGGFLYNLKVAPMEKPTDYSAEKIKEVVARYQNKETVSLTEQPNIIYIMAESFSNPLRLQGFETDGNPLAVYDEIAAETYSGRMLSQNIGGGTANIEFEALTGLSMEPFNGQMTTPYTMLVPKLNELPSLVSLLNERNYETTAVHPFNTSMYKRKDVYNVLGFEHFMAEDTMTHKEKMENNLYISDASAYQEILPMLEKDKPQFVHLVTMQTHMPYGSKYSSPNYDVSGVEDPALLNNYMQDIEYSSQALKDFLTALDDLPRRTLVVFWGDHLPGLYDQETQEKNEDIDLHLTEFMMYDSKTKLISASKENELLSPIYFAPELFARASLPKTGFYELLLKLKDVMPAFEKNYYLVNDEWQPELVLPEETASVYHDYQLIQYDLVAGKQYSLKENFFSN